MFTQLVLFYLINDQQLCSRCKCTPSGNLCAWRFVGGPAAHHWCVWKALAQKQAVLSYPRGTTHPVQHSPHLRGGQLSWSPQENTSFTHTDKK